MQKTIGGNRYATGFGLILHPVWQVNKEYAVDDKITYYDAIYICILTHTSDITNSPISDNSSTYWAVVPGGTKSEFVVSADSFIIRKPDGSHASLFDGAVINTDLYSGFEGLIELAQLGETIIQGGYIKTDLINTGAIAIGDLSGANTVIANANLRATLQVIWQGLLTKI